MTRDARKRWLTRITLAALTGLIGLGMWLPWGFSPRPADAPGPDDQAVPAAAPGPAVPQAADVTGPVVLQAADEINAPDTRETGPLGPLGPDVSLVVAELEAVPGRHAHRTRVIRYDFKNGQVQPPETVWDGPFDHFNYPASWQPIIENRYLFAANGSVLDLQEKILIHQGAGRLIEVSGDRVISGVYSPEGELERLVAFSLQARAIEQLTDHELETLIPRSHLIGPRSPDGMKCVFCWDDTLLLQRVGQPTKDLGRVNVGENNFYPGLWLDNERFLTQDGYGNLLTVGLDGVRVPVVRVPIKPLPRWEGPALFPDVLPVQVPVEEEVNSWFEFRRDADGRIIYECNGREHFFINTEAKTWERCQWESRGHGFAERSLGDDKCRRIWRYKGTEIARSPYCAFGTAAKTTEGYIAVFVESGLCVWSVGTGKWTNLGTRTHCIAGWIK